MMTTNNLTSEKYSLRDNSPELMHRFLGPAIYGADIDYIMNSANEITQTDGTIMTEFTYKSGELKNVAIIEYKHGNILTVRNSAAMKSVKALADAASLPMFVVVYYGLDADHPVPMMLVIPANYQAALITPTKWCSVFEYSRLMHKLRKKVFNPFASLADASTPVEARVLYSLSGKAAGAAINDLSKVVQPYPSPDYSQVEFRL